MIELELFYNIATSSIQADRAHYLEKIKQVPFERDLPEIKELNAKDYAKLMFFERRRYKRYLRKQKRRYKRAVRRQKSPIDDYITKGYNAGIKRALSILEAEYKEFDASLDKDK